MSEYDAAYLAMQENGQQGSASLLERSESSSQRAVGLGKQFNDALGIMLVTPSPGYMLVVTLAKVAHFFYMCATLDSAYQSATPDSAYASYYQSTGLDAGWSSSPSDLPSGWYRYEQFYVRVVNSGWLTLGPNLILAMMSSLANEENKASRSENQSMLLAFTAICQFTFFLPIAVTHIIPAIMLYPVIFGGPILFFCMDCKPEVGQRI
jgi:hypothetical protein